MYVAYKLYLHVCQSELAIYNITQTLPKIGGLQHPLPHSSTQLVKGWFCMVSINLVH